MTIFFCLRNNGQTSSFFNEIFALFGIWKHINICIIFLKIFNGPFLGFLILFNTHFTNFGLRAGERLFVYSFRWTHSTIRRIRNSSSYHFRLNLFCLGFQVMLNFIINAAYYVFFLWVLFRSDVRSHLFTKLGELFLMMVRSHMHWFL